MIEELKTLLDAVSEIPTLAVWVAFGFLVYKVFIWGSVVAALLKGWQLFIAALNNYTEKRTALQSEVEAQKTIRGDQEVKKAEIDKRPIVKEFRIDEITISGCEAVLRNQIQRIAGKGLGIESRYIHERSVDWLREAIDEKELREAGDE